MKPLLFASEILALALASISTHVQTPTDIPVPKGLSPVNALGKSDAGQSALGANYALTGGIETGEITQPTLLPFVEQEGKLFKKPSLPPRTWRVLLMGWELPSELLMLLGCITSIKITLPPCRKP